MGISGSLGCCGDWRAAAGARSPLLQKEKFVCDAMPEQQPERQQPERGAADVEAALPLFQGVRYSLLFGECNGWLGCSHCRKWRRAVEAFSAEQRAKPLDERCCMACSRLEEARIEDGDLRPSIAECARHSGNLDQRRVNLFLGKGLPRAEAHLAQLAAKECMSPESVALQRAKRDIVKFDRNTDGWWLARIDYEWVARVDAAADAAALATELLYMLDAQSAKGKRELAEMSGRPMQALVDTLKDVEGGRATAVLSEHRALLPPVIVTPDGSIASVGVRLVEYVARELLQKAGLLNAHRKAQKAGTRLVADFKAVTDAEAQRDEDLHDKHLQAAIDLFCVPTCNPDTFEVTFTERGKRRRRSAVVLSKDRRLSAAEVAELRAAGKAPLSGVERGELRDGCVPWRTDAYELPEQGQPCFVSALLAGAAMPSMKALLGGRTDAVAGLADEVDFEWFQGLRERNALAPVAALELREEPVEKWAVLQRSEGVFIIGACMRKAGGRAVQQHFIAWNAGTWMLYLGPWVWMLSANDFADLQEVAHRVEMEYGIFLNEGSTCRRLWFAPAHDAALQLPYNVPQEVRALRGECGALRPGMSKDARKRARKKAQRAESSSMAE